MPTARSNEGPVRIGADDPRIRYIGRFDFSYPQKVRYDWSGVAIEVAFSGPSVSIMLDDGANYYNVTVDGQTRILQTEAEETTYQIAQNLAEGTHQLRITKRTEAYVGNASFSGFVLAAGHDLLEKPAAATRQILFVGDSITTGYGNEGASPGCWFTAETQNVARTYAAITADHFDAEYHIVALSGLGVVRNLRADTASSPVTAIDFLDRAMAMNAVLKWEPESEGPDVVIVNLGTNDFSTQPVPETEVFIEAYRDLLRRIRERYEEAEIFAVSGPLMLDPAPSAIRNAVDRLRTLTKDEKITTVEIENTLDQSGADFGCDWHPNVEGHIKIANQLVPVVADKLHW